MACNTSGRILILARTQSDLEHGNLVVFAFRSDGQVEAEFGVGGIVELPNERLQPQEIHAFPDGGALILSRSLFPDPSRFRVTKLDGNGALDPTFGDGGQLELGLRTRACRLLTLSDGRFVASGYDPTSRSVLRVQRRLADGALDTSFGAGGEIAVPLAFPNSVGFVTGAAPDGSLLACGAYGSARLPGNQAFLMALRPDGAVHRGFGKRGLVVTRLGSSAQWRLTRVDARGGVIAVGVGAASRGGSFVLGRFHGFPEWATPKPPLGAKN